MTGPANRVPRRTARIRRRPAAAGDPRRFWDARERRWTVQVLPGELYVTAEDELVTTVLGSCVTTCIRDPARQVGGINHFMLPHAPRGAEPGAAARYGAVALEHLINRVLAAGGRRQELEVKMFGGGRVIRGGDIGADNVAFVRAFLEADRLPLSAEDVGGPYARRVRYWPRTGRVQVLRLPMAAAARILDAEARLATAPVPRSGPIEIF